MFDKHYGKTIVIAEIGNNHEGDFNTAIKLIDAAKKAGVDAVKFQTFKTELYVSKTQKERYKKLKKFELSYEQFAKLSKYSRDLNLKFISTPFDIISANFLSKIVDAIKISSGDNNFFQLIDNVIEKNLPLIISTGMTNLNDVINLEKYLIKKNFNLKQCAFLHCVTDYPTDFKEANLRSICVLVDNLNSQIGYSDHTMGIDASIISVALGAKLIEKHFTLDNNFSEFRDHHISADPKEMKILVERIRRTEILLGDFRKKIQSSERKNISASRRSIYANKKIKKGKKINESDLKIVRPFNNLSPSQMKQIIGKSSSKDLNEDDEITYELIK